MDRQELLVYPANKFSEFYTTYCSNYDIIPISALLNQMVQLEIFNLDNERHMIDITYMINQAINNRAVLLVYESWLSSLIHNNSEIYFVVDDISSKAALKLFPYYFSTERYIIEPDSSDEENTSIKRHSTKSIEIYVKDNFNEFRSKKLINSYSVLSISELLTKKHVLDFEYNDIFIKNEERYLIDITSMIIQLELRKDYLLQFEIILIELSSKNNVEFCLDSEYVDKCKEYFRHIFNHYVITPLEKVNTTPDYKSIVDYNFVELQEKFDIFSNRLYGHKDFKKDLINQLRAFSVLNKMGKNKVFSIFLCGDSGLGKTEVARLLHQIFYHESMEIKINFGNYTGQGSLWSLIGSPKGYKGSEEGGELTNKIRKSNSKVILIDEFEKADESIFTYFYELLEDGKCTDLDENEFDLNGYIIVFTANLTNENYAQKIPEPLLSRFDMKYEFSPLTELEKSEFIKHVADDLIESYKKVYDYHDDGEMYQKLMMIDKKNINNLRDLKRSVTLKFIDVVIELNSQI